LWPRPEQKVRPYLKNNQGKKDCGRGSSCREATNKNTPYKQKQKKNYTTARRKPTRLCHTLGMGKLSEDLEAIKIKTKGFTTYGLGVWLKNHQTTTTTTTRPKI
jgi:hypothetical protein